METVEIVLTGKQLALLSGAAVLLPSWPFERAAARAVAHAISFEHADNLAEAVGDSMVAQFTAAGVWSAGTPWTQALIDRRAALAARVCLSKQQARAAVAALESCVAEFENSWWEFEVVAPGVGMYSATPADLSSLAELIRAALTVPANQTLGDGREPAVPTSRS